MLGQVFLLGIKTLLLSALVHLELNCCRLDEHLFLAKGRKVRPSSLDYGDCRWPCFMLFHKCLMDILDSDIAIDVFTCQLYLVFIPNHLMAGAGETYHQVRTFVSLARGSGFDSQNPCDSYQLFATSVTEDLTPSSGLLGHCTHVTHRHMCRQNYLYI